MKKTITTLLSLFLLTAFSFAQKSMSFGITGGATMSSYKVSQDNISSTSKSKIGFTVGLISFIGLGESITFQPALNYTQKGGKVKETDWNDALTLNYVELPLNVVYNKNLGTGKFFIGAGPSLAYAFSGKDKWSTSTESGNDKVNIGSADTDDMKPFEAGVNFLTGYQLPGGFLVSANYNLGLSNLANTSGTADAKMHNRYFGLKVGYVFGTR